MIFPKSFLLKWSLTNCWACLPNLSHSPSVSLRAQFSSSQLNSPQLCERQLESRGGVGLSLLQNCKIRAAHTFYLLFKPNWSWHLRLLFCVLSFINFEYQLLSMSSVADQIGHVLYAESAFWKWLRSDQGQIRRLGDRSWRGSSSKGEVAHWEVKEWSAWEDEKRRCWTCELHKQHFLHGW